MSDELLDFIMECVIIVVAVAGIRLCLLQNLINEFVFQHLRFGDVPKFGEPKSITIYKQPFMVETNSPVFGQEFRHVGYHTRVESLLKFVKVLR